MSQDAPLWLGLLGAITGILGLLTAVASAWYTRRAALAAEGPSYPQVEVAHHRWDTENPGWYMLDFVIRNRTADAWEITSAKAGRFISEPIFSIYSRPATGESYDQTPIPLNDIPEEKLPKIAVLELTSGPLGSKHFHGHGGDIVHFSLFLRPSAFSRSTSRLWVSLNLSAKTERVRHKDIAVTRRLKPIPITAT